MAISGAFTIGGMPHVKLLSDWLRISFDCAIEFSPQVGSLVKRGEEVQKSRPDLMR
jgi:hypothetical protein